MLRSVYACPPVAAWDAIGYFMVGVRVATCGRVGCNQRCYVSVRMATGGRWGATSRRMVHSHYTNECLYNLIHMHELIISRIKYGNIIENYMVN